MCLWLMKVRAEAWVTPSDSHRMGPAFQVHWNLLQFSFYVFQSPCNSQKYSCEALVSRKRVRAYLLSAPCWMIQQNLIRAGASQPFNVTVSILSMYSWQGSHLSSPKQLSPLILKDKNMFLQGIRIKGGFGLCFCWCLCGFLFL